jgi:hypothetical protein
MVVAFIALFMAIGGGSYALAQARIGSKQLKRSAVRTANLANNAVTGAKVRNGALTGADIRENTLAGVASAANATNAGHANSSAALDRITYVRQAGSVGPGVDAGGGNVTATIGGGAAVCPAGQLPIAGGVGVDNNQDTSVVDSFPDPGARAWRVRIDNSGLATNTFTVVAICVPAGAAG